MSASDRQLDTAIEVVTPENIAFTYRIAGPFRRLSAFLIDFGLRMALLVAIAMIGSLLLQMARISVADSIMAGVLLLASFVSEWFYGGLFETFMNGQTPGKRMMGLRVVTTAGQPINGLQAVMRNILRYADSLPALSLEIFELPYPMYVIPVATMGLASMMLTRRFQRLGDLVCDTMVVVEDRQWLMGIARLDDPRAVQLAAYLPMKFQVSRSMAKAIAAYVERRRFFSIPRRREIARHLGEPLLERFGLPPDTSHDLLLCALYYRTFIADRKDDEEHAAALSPGLASPLPGPPYGGFPAGPPPLGPYAYPGQVAYPYPVPGYAPYPQGMSVPYGGGYPAFPAPSYSPSSGSPGGTAPRPPA